MYLSRGDGGAKIVANADEFIGEMDKVVVKKESCFIILCFGMYCDMKYDHVCDYFTKLQEDIYLKIHVFI